jgi:hypothetical protein
MYPVGYEPAPPYDPATQYIETSAQPSLVGDQWLLTKTVVNMTPEQIKAREDRLKAENKAQASTLLQQTDWVELGDVADPANPPYLSNKAAFTAYRAALRSIAVNPPTTPAVFPAKPDEVWLS